MRGGGKKQKPKLKARELPTMKAADQLKARFFTGTFSRISSII
jgi:hypothetical protein